jgi:hypothetical protein
MNNFKTHGTKTNEGTFCTCHKGVARKEVCSFLKDYTNNSVRELQRPALIGSGHFEEIMHYYTMHSHSYVTSGTHLGDVTCPTRNCDHGMFQRNMPS